jgi:hypothetical protein
MESMYLALALEVMTSFEFFCITTFFGLIIGLVVVA